MPSSLSTDAVKHFADLLKYGMMDGRVTIEESFRFSRQLAETQFYRFSISNRNTDDLLAFLAVMDELGI